MIQQWVNTVLLLDVVETARALRTLGARSVPPASAQSIAAFRSGTAVIETILQ